MIIQNIFYSTHFARAFQRLPKDIQEKAIRREALFRRDCFQPSLKTHKLKGALADYWSFSIDYSYRILFAFGEKNSADFIDVGPHDVYN